MKDHLVSFFIDNELTLQEKVDFIEAVADDGAFYMTARELLRQEQTLGAALAEVQPALAGRQVQPVQRHGWGAFWQLRSASFASGFVLACCLVAFLPFFRGVSEPAIPGDETYRFVLYLPAAGEASVIGTFSDWSPIPMEKVGDTGYWTLNVKLPPGEYRYSYLIEQQTRILDPTVPGRETDDFGGENSILYIAGVLQSDQSSS